MLSVLRFFHVHHIQEIIDRLQITQEQRAMFKIIYFVVNLLTTIHILACFWHIIIMREQIWIPPMDFVSSGHWEIIHDFYHPTDALT